MKQPVEQNLSRTWYISEVAPAKYSSVSIWSCMSPVCLGYMVLVLITYSLAYQADEHRRET